MATLTDTNILLRLLQPHHPHCRTAERALSALRLRNEILYVAPQNLVELWAVATRPGDQNGLGFTIEQTAKELEAIKNLWAILPEVPIFEEWERLVKTYRISGKSTHDARLVAAMHVHGIDSILTFNTNDFARYAGLTVIDPATLA